MSLQKSDLMMKELTEYLDELPTTPCTDPPASRYFCTVCERLNKSVSGQCRIYKSRSEEVGLVRKGGYDDLPDEDIPLSGPGDEPDKVEFKVVTDEDLDGRGMPMFEIVKPSVEDTEPLEMSLLEKEAIEFELTGDQGISSDAIEVEPMEVEELEDDFEGLEVEPLEVDELEDDLTLEAEDSEAAAPAATAGQTAVSAAPSVSSRASGKPKKIVRKPKVKAAPAAVSTPAAVQPASPKPAAVSIPKPAVVSTPKPAVAKASRPVQVRKPAPAASPPPQQSEDVPGDLLKDIEEQLISTSNCTQCGAGLTNTKFCTQCGAKVVITADGVHTEARVEAPAAKAPVPTRKVRRKVVKKR